MEDDVVDRFEYLQRAELSHADRNFNNLHVTQTFKQLPPSGC